MKKLKQFIIPFGANDQLTKLVSLGILPILIAAILHSTDKFPPITEILSAFPKLLTENNLLDNFITSIAFCFKCVLYSALVSFVFFVVAQVPVFKPLASFSRKFRFLPSVGLSFLFMRLTSDVEGQMTAIMIFGISTYLIDSAVGLALSVTQDQVDYCKSLRMSPIETLRELVIYGKLAEFFQSVVANFAIAWMLLASVENICKSSGGIGVVISESAKYMRLDEVYAIQILILATGIGLDFTLGKVRDFLFPYTILKKTK